MAKREKEEEGKGDGNISKSVFGVGFHPLLRGYVFSLYFSSTQVTPCVFRLVDPVLVVG